MGDEDTHRFFKNSTNTGQDEEKPSFSFTAEERKNKAQPFLKGKLTSLEIFVPSRESRAP